MGIKILLILSFINLLILYVEASSKNEDENGIDIPCAYHINYIRELTAAEVLEAKIESLIDALYILDTQFINVKRFPKMSINVLDQESKVQSLLFLQQQISKRIEESLHAYLEKLKANQKVIAILKSNKVKEANVDVFLKTEFEKHFFYLLAEMILSTLLNKDFETLIQRKTEIQIVDETEKEPEFLFNYNNVVTNMKNKLQWLKKEDIYSIPDIAQDLTKIKIYFVPERSVAINTKKNLLAEAQELVPKSNWNSLKKTSLGDETLIIIYLNHVDKNRVYLATDKMANESDAKEIAERILRENQVFKASPYLEGKNGNLSEYHLDTYFYLALINGVLNMFNEFANLPSTNPMKKEIDPEELKRDFTIYQKTLETGILNELNQISINTQSLKSININFANCGGSKKYVKNPAN